MLGVFCVWRSAVKAGIAIKNMESTTENRKQFLDFGFKSVYSMISNVIFFIEIKTEKQNLGLHDIIMQLDINSNFL